MFYIPTLLDLCPQRWHFLCQNGIYINLVLDQHLQRMFTENSVVDPFQACPVISALQKVT